MLNAGGYFDPLQDGARPIGVQLGVSVDVELVRGGRLSFHGEAATTIALAVDPQQFVLAAGLTFSPTENVDFSVLALVGLLPGEICGF